ncbi:MAG TPA: threonine synthase [Bellilinea sp.]|nr:threonine synthase [Bellilinea sp.]
MGGFIGYRCSICQQEYLPDQVTYVCPQDGGNLDVILDHAGIRKKYDPMDITSRANASLWRYLPLLPVTDPGGNGTPLKMAGWTPVYKPERLARDLGVSALWIKDESRNPTASFKDRASAVVVARARQINAQMVVTSSSGNAGAALAGMAAAIGQPATVFVPKAAPSAKVAQLLVYGAQVFLVDGNYDAAYELSQQAANEFGWYCRNTGYNPFTLEGKKTAAFEIWEMVMADLPEGTTLSIFVSVGDGNIIAGLHKGFKDLQTLGWLDQMPRIYGIQAENSAAIANAFQNHTENIEAVQAATVADSISVDFPRDGVRALRAATQTGGAYLTVTDAEIIAAIAGLGPHGIFAEPAGAAAFAGYRKALSTGVISPESPALVINTGSGLKDVRAAMQAVALAPIVAPDLHALKKVLGY